MAAKGTNGALSPIPDVEIELDKVRNLRFDFNALRLAEKTMSQEWGKKTSVTSVLNEDITVTDLTILVWAALKQQDKTLTLDQVGAMLHPSRLAYIGGKIRDAFAVQAASDEEEGAQENPSLP